MWDRNDAGLRGARMWNGVTRYDGNRLRMIADTAMAGARRIRLGGSRGKPPGNNDDAFR